MLGFKFINAAKEKLRRKTPIVEFQFIVMKHNEAQRNNARQLAKKLKADVYLEKTVGIDFNDPNSLRMAEKFLPGDLSLDLPGDIVTESGAAILAVPLHGQDARATLVPG